MARILVTGGTGYIGSHTTVELIEAGYEVIIVDNFSNSDRSSLEGIEKITGVKPLFIEADSEDTREHLMRFARSISSRVEYADSARRKHIHLAGVFVNNFTNHMYHIGAEVVEDEGLSFDVLKPLIEETARKAVDATHPRSVQTGPAVRGDVAVAERHLQMLADDERKQQIYKLITESIWETSKKI